MRPLSNRAMRYFRDFDGHAAVPRDAATVVLMRDSARGVEVLLLRRPPTMAFAPRMHVFPGGGVRSSDFEDGVPWAGPSPRRWAEIFRCPPELALALVVAAVRETYEETGILLAGPDSTTLVTAGSEVVRGDTARAALEAGRVSFREFLLARGLVLRADVLYAWAHWITPAYEPRRYDTRFFAAKLPAGQKAGVASAESERALWVPAGQAADAARAGELAMLPPTRHTCRRVGRMAGTRELAVAAAHPLATIEPKVIEVGGQLFLDGPPNDDF